MYRKQNDTNFLIHIISKDKVEVRRSDSRDDYIITSLTKTLENKLTSRGKKEIPVGNIYEVVGEDILLETESPVRGLLHGETLLNKVYLSKLKAKAIRVYGVGTTKEITDHPITPIKTFTDNYKDHTL